MQWSHWKLILFSTCSTSGWSEESGGGDGKMRNTCLWTCLFNSQHNTSHRYSSWLIALLIPYTENRNAFQKRVIFMKPQLCKLTEFLLINWVEGKKKQPTNQKPTLKYTEYLFVSWRKNMTWWSIHRINVILMSKLINFSYLRRTKRLNNQLRVERSIVEGL